MLNVIFMKLNVLNMVKISDKGGMKVGMGECVRVPETYFVLVLLHIYCIGKGHT